MTTVEDLYRQIGNYIAEVIQGSWESAWIQVEFKPGVLSAQGRYTKPNDTVVYGFVVVGKIARLFLQLRELMKKDELNKWSRAKFSLKPNGDFKLDIGYASSADHPEGQSDQPAEGKGE